MASITISVTNPTKLMDKFGPYMSYMVNTSSTRPGLGSAGNSVARRYSDFEWLSKELAKAFPGIIIPPVPDKQAVGRFQDEFVESRRRSLEKFLVRIANHEDLCDAQAFHTFLNADDTELSIAKEKK